MTTSRYVVLGAGGVGGVVAGFLAAAGEDVVLVARGEHGRRIASEGLLIGTPRGSFCAHPGVIASTDEWQPEARDVLLVAIKSQDVRDLFADLASKPVDDSFVGRRIPVFCFQNGLANEGAALRYFSRVHGVCVGIPGVYLDAGRVDAHGHPVPGVLEVGRHPHSSDERDAELVEALTHAGFRAYVTDEVVPWKAAKLIGNLRNAIDALFPADRGNDAVKRLFEAAQSEARACYVAASLTEVDPESLAEHRQGFCEEPVDGTARVGGSTWQSVVRGLSSAETDYLNGEIALLGRLHGVPTPVNEALQEHMWMLMAQERRGSTNTAADLAEALGIVA